MATTHSRASLPTPTVEPLQKVRLARKHATLRSSGTLSEVLGAQVAAQKMKEDAAQKIKDLRREMELARSEATSWQVRNEPARDGISQGEEVQSRAFTSASEVVESRLREEVKILTNKLNASEVRLKHSRAKIDAREKMIAMALARTVKIMDALLLFRVVRAWSEGVFCKDQKECSLMRTYWLNKTIDDYEKRIAALTNERDSREAKFFDVALRFSGDTLSVSSVFETWRRLSFKTKQTRLLCDVKHAGINDATKHANLTRVVHSWRHATMDTRQERHKLALNDQMDFMSSASHQISNRQALLRPAIRVWYMQKKVGHVMKMVNKLTATDDQSREQRNRILQRVESSQSSLRVQVAFNHWKFFHETFERDVPFGEDGQVAPMVWGAEGAPTLDAFHGGWLWRNGWGASLPDYPGPRRLDRTKAEAAVYPYNGSPLMPPHESRFRCSKLVTEVYLDGSRHAETAGQVLGIERCGTSSRCYWTS